MCPLKTALTFNNKSFTIENLLNDIETGLIALPDIQRPYVWDTTKARDLIDSIYKGLPTGSIVLWEIYQADSVRPIYPDAKVSPKYLVIDGQQRLTSLFSIIKNKEILSKSGKRFKIKIAFNPIEERFEVSNTAIEKDVKWISDISLIFSGSTFSFTKEYLEKLKEKNLEVDENEVASRIERLAQIKNYPFSVIELSPELNEEQVAEIFVRINSKGQNLYWKDFILTLLSIYYPEGRDKLEEFYEKSLKQPIDNKPSPFNIMKMPAAPEHLLRTIIGLAFRRGRLMSGYALLKGRDFENKITSEEVRNQNLEKFKIAQETALNLTNWHDYIKIIHSAGFVNKDLISSHIAFFITYCFYLIGKEYNVDYKLLESYIKKWFVFSILTQRYTGSPESVIENDLSNLSKYDFISYIENQLKINLTEDYWNIQLPEVLQTSSVTNNAYLVYLASLINSDIKILFSNIKLKDYLNPFIVQKKKQIDIHHIFPKAI